MAKAEKGLSIREFARREGCSDTLVRRAITQGRLKAKKDGRLDPALIGSPWRQANATASKSAAKPARPSANQRAGLGRPLSKAGERGRQYLGELVDQHGRGRARSDARAHRTWRARNHGHGQYADAEDSAAGEHIRVLRAPGSLAVSTKPPRCADEAKPPRCADEGQEAYSCRCYPTC